jgi:hypothetical protein
MRNRLNWFMVTVVLAALVVGLSFSVSSVTARATAPAAQEHHEGYEDMHHAQKLLQDARAVLAGAPGEYGGYRDKAIKKVDEALIEVQNAIKHH